MFQVTVSGVRNAVWCVTAFGIVACAATPLTAERLALAQQSIERAEQADAADFAQMELSAARSKYAAAQAAAQSINDTRDAELATMLAEQADVDAQLAEQTARAKQSEKLAGQLDAQMRDLREESLRRAGADLRSP